MLDRTYVVGQLNKTVFAVHSSLFNLFYSIGVTIIELIISELLLYSIIGIAQVTLISFIVYAMFDVSCYAYNHIELVTHVSIFNRFKCTAILPQQVSFTGLYHCQVYSCIAKRLYASQQVTVLFLQDSLLVSIVFQVWLNSRCCHRHVYTLFRAGNFCCRQYSAGCYIYGFINIYWSFLFIWCVASK